MEHKSPHERTRLIEEFEIPLQLIVITMTVEKLRIEVNSTMYASTTSRDHARPHVTQLVRLVVLETYRCIEISIIDVPNIDVFDRYFHYIDTRIRDIFFTL